MIFGNLKIHKYSSILVTMKLRKDSFVVVVYCNWCYRIDLVAVSCKFWFDLEDTCFLSNENTEM